MKHKQLTYNDERADSKELLKQIANNKHPISLILDRLQSPANAGAIFRLAEAARIEKIFLFQSSFSFNDRKFKRASRSTKKYVDYELIADIEKIKNLKKDWQLVALEKTNNSIPYTDFRKKEGTKLALIIGHESTGVSEELLALAEEAIHIPMFGLNTSMNVVTATAISVYKFLELGNGF